MSVADTWTGGRFVTELATTPIGERRWKTDAPLRYQSPRLRVVVGIAPGFVTDFASIPRILWAVLPPSDGDYDAAAVVHDWLYTYADDLTRRIGHAVSRADADAVLLEAMTALGVRPWKRRVIYAGVRIGGWLFWRRRRAQARADV